MNPVTRRTILAVALCLFSLVRAPAQTQGGDPEIAELEAAYRAELVEIRQELGSKWLAALSNFKDELTREQKLTEALLVRGEEKRVATLLDSDPIPSGSAAAVTKIALAASAAKLGGATEISGKTGGLAFSEADSSATWELPADLTPGTYELIIHFRAGNFGGGTYAASIGDDQTLNGAIVPTPEDAGSWKTERRALVGECVLDEYTGSLAITSLTHNGAALMILELVEFAPLGTWEEMQSAPAVATQKRPGRREFEKLEGAKWIDKDTRKSGEFVVKHGDKEHTFRLYFAQLPPTTVPTSRSKKAELARTARQLRTTEAKLLHFGKKVDESLRDDIWSETLTIYTMWESRGRADSHYAYILVNDEPFSLSLIESGRARLGGSYATSAPFLGKDKKSGSTFRNQLKAAEQTARKSRRGMWGL